METSETMATTQPHVTVRGSRTSHAIADLLDLLGRRNALRLLWELRDGHAQTFRTLRESCGDVSPTLLNTRLKELRAAALVEHGSGGYQLTALGQTLLLKLGPLNGWAKRWAQQREEATK